MEKRGDRILFKEIIHHRCRSKCGNVPLDQLLLFKLACYLLIPCMYNWRRAVDEYTFSQLARCILNAESDRSLWSDVSMK